MKQPVSNRLEHEAKNVKAEIHAANLVAVVCPASFDSSGSLAPLYNKLQTFAFVSILMAVRRLYEI